MTLIVEDGSGKPNADAFVSVDDCTAYCAAHGLTSWTDAARSPSDDDEAAIRRATAWLSTAFTYKGSRTHGRGQALAFPRECCTDGEGAEIAPDEVPFEIIHACCIAAAYERANPGGLTPTVVPADRVKSEQIGPIRTEYASTAMTADAAKPVLTRAESLIGGLLSQTANGLVGRLLRG